MIARSSFKPFKAGPSQTSWAIGHKRVEHMITVITFASWTFEPRWYPRIRLVSRIRFHATGNNTARAAYCLCLSADPRGCGWNLCWRVAVAPRERFSRTPMEEMGVGRLNSGQSFRGNFCYRTPFHRYCISCSRAGVEICRPAPQGSD